MAIGAPALRFYLRNRQELFPAAPVLVTGGEQRVVEMFWVIQRIAAS